MNFLQDELQSSIKLESRITCYSLERFLEICNHLYLIDFFAIQASFFLDFKPGTTHLRPDSLGEVCADESKCSTTSNSVVVVIASRKPCPFVIGDSKPSTISRSLVERVHNEESRYCNYN